MISILWDPANLLSSLCFTFRWTDHNQCLERPGVLPEQSLENDILAYRRSGLWASGERLPATKSFWLDRLRFHTAGPASKNSVLLHRSGVYLLSLLHPTDDAQHKAQPIHQSGLPKQGQSGLVNACGEICESVHKSDFLCHDTAHSRGPVHFLFLRLLHKVHELRGQTTVSKAGSKQNGHADQWIPDIHTDQRMRSVPTGSGAFERPSRMPISVGQAYLHAL